MRALALALAIWFGAGSPACAEWYVAHVGRETCIPLRNVGSRGERLYYGGGSMETPNDLLKAFRGPGYFIWRNNVGALEKYAADYDVNGPDDFSAHFLFFNDQTICRKYMSRLKE